MDGDLISQASGALTADLGSRVQSLRVEYGEVRRARIDVAPGHLQVHRRMTSSLSIRLLGIAALLCSGPAVATEPRVGPDIEVRKERLQGQLSVNVFTFRELMRKRPNAPYLAILEPHDQSKLEDLEYEVRLCSVIGKCDRDGDPVTFVLDTNQPLPRDFVAMVKRGCSFRHVGWSAPMRLKDCRRKRPLR